MYYAQHKMYKKLKEWEKGNILILFHIINLLMIQTLFLFTSNNILMRAMSLNLLHYLILG